MFEQLLQQFSSTAPAGARTAVGTLYGSAASRLLIELAASADVQLVITADSHAASQLLRELAFYGRDSDIELLGFPDWETLPYDHFSPHQDIVSERLHTLHRLPRLQRGILVGKLSRENSVKSYIYDSSLSSIWRT